MDPAEPQEMVDPAEPQGLEALQGPMDQAEGPAAPVAPGPR